MYSGDISTPAGEDFYLSQVQQTAGSMSAWLKFLGVLSIVSGALSVLSIVGIIFAWIPIWMGVLLFQAGDRARQTALGNDASQLLSMMQKLRLYFVISGIVTIVVLTFSVLAIVFMSAFVDQFSTRLQEMMMQY